MTPKESKHMRTLLRAIRKYADENNVPVIAKMATEGLRVVKRLTPPAR